MLAHLKRNKHHHFLEPEINGEVLTKGGAAEHLRDIVAKYPEVPRLIIMKTDVQRRGVFYTDAALSVLDEKKHSITGTHIFGTRDGKITPRPESLLLRDGTSIITTPTAIEENPYVVDLLDGQPFLFDEGEPIEEVDYWPAPAFYGKLTHSGIPMQKIVSARPQRLVINPHRYCTFWKNGNGCTFCDIVEQIKKGKKDLQIQARPKAEEIAEIVAEALKEPGRYSAVFLTSGSVINGSEPFDEEIDIYIKVFNELGKLFRTKKFPSQIIGTAYSEVQLERLYLETGLMSYTADIEVLNEDLFNRHCPGKAEWIGYKEWKRRLVKAVDIFGRGFVNTGLVAGIELTTPHGFKTEEEALQRTLEEADDLARQGVSTVFIVWSPRPNTVIGNQKNASLDYYIKLAKGLHELRLTYKLPIMFDDYRHCGNHPDTDLSRLLPF